MMKAMSEGHDGGIFHFSQTCRFASIIYWVRKEGGYNIEDIIDGQGLNTTARAIAETHLKALPIDFWDP